MGGALILAAGFSRRFGSDKRSHLIRVNATESMPMVCATARIYTRVFAETVVVLRAQDHEIQALLECELPQIRCVTATDSHLGMGHSLAAGIAAIEHWHYAFVALADMPYVRTASLEMLQQKMVEKLAEAPDAGVIVAPVCEGQRGHPVGFSRGCFPQLQTLTGDRGARELMAAAGEHLHSVALDDPGLLQDLDRPE